MANMGYAFELVQNWHLVWQELGANSAAHRFCAAIGMAGPLRPFPLRRRAVASDDVARPKTVANLRQVVPTSCCTPA